MTDKFKLEILYKGKVGLKEYLCKFFQFFKILLVHVHMICTPKSFLLGFCMQAVSW
jgi:hypothetical protein